MKAGGCLSSNYGDVPVLMFAKKNFTSLVIFYYYF